MSNASLELGGGNWAAKDNGDGTGSLLGYAVGDTSGKYLPREFTFSRGADIGATRVNKDGLIEKYRENLLLQSNQFDTTWSATRANLTSGQSGYDGTSNAWLLESNDESTAFVEQTISLSAVQTFSVYAKAGTGDYVILYNISTSTNPRAWFNLSTGQKGSTVASDIAAEMEDVGNGWWRCSVTYEKPITSVRIYVGETNDLFSTADGKNIYIQDAQLEQGLVATDYIDSGSTTGKAGVLDNLPRIDYTSGSAQLLMEPSRTNLLEHSEYINTTDWIHQNVTSSVNTIETTSPEAVYNAVKFTATNTDPYIFKVVSVSAVDNTFSFYVKGTGSSVGKTARILFWYVGTATGTQTSHNFTLTDEWQRVEATTSPTGGGTLAFRIDIPADSAVVGDVCYLYGLQIEAGSSATSYIPTYGASDTRAFDDVDHFDTSVLGFGTTCSIYFEGVINEASGLYLRPVTMFGSGFDTSERFLLFGQQFSGGTYKLTSRHNSGGATNGVDKAGLTIGEKVKCVSVFDGTSQKFFVNGSFAGTDTVPAAEIFEYLDLSNIASDQSHTIESLQLYPVALSDAECIALTTL